MVEAYLTDLTARLAGTVEAAWIVGSSALGDFDPARSDVDVQAVSATRLPGPELRALAAALTAVPCPVRGLEFVLYARDEAPRFSLNLNTGPGMDHHEGYDPDAEASFWFTLDVSIARQHARPLLGPHPQTVLPELPQDVVREAARESLRWWRGHDGGQAILAGCRAWAWASDGSWRSKGDAAEWAIARLDDPAPVHAALAARSGDPGPTPGQVDAFLAWIDV
jgi:hypothetical protein